MVNYRNIIPFARSRYNGSNGNGRGRAGTIAPERPRETATYAPPAEAQPDIRYTPHRAFGQRLIRALYSHPVLGGLALAGIAAAIAVPVYVHFNGGSKPPLREPIRQVEQIKPGQNPLTQNPLSQNPVVIPPPAVNNIIEPTLAPPPAAAGSSEHVGPIHVPQSVPTATPLPTPPPPIVLRTNPTYIFGSGIPPAYQQDLRNAVERVRNYSQQTLGVKTGDFTFFAFMDIGNHIDAYIEWHKGLSPKSRDNYLSRWTNVAPGHGGNQHLFVCTGCDPDTKIKSAFHEYFHVLQSELANVQENPRLGAAIVHPSQVSPHGPEWLHEGTAEYLALQVASDAKMSRFTWNMDNHLHRARTQTLPLNSMETRFGLDKAGDYSSGVAAAKLLAETSGTQSLMKFYERAGEGLSWKEAFEVTFGQSIDEFYAKFEATK